jgi:hypothetical protein
MFVYVASARPIDNPFAPWDELQPEAIHLRNNTSTNRTLEAVSFLLAGLKADPNNGGSCFALDPIKYKVIIRPDTIPQGIRTRTLSAAPHRRRENQRGE